MLGALSSVSKRTTIGRMERDDNISPMPAASSPGNAKVWAYWQQTIQNRILLVVLCMVLLVPSLASPSNEALQGAANKALQVMAALLAGILVLRARFPIKRADILAFLGTGPNLYLLLYLAASVISLLLGPAAPSLRRFGLAELQRIVVSALLYFALAYHVRRSEHLVKIQGALTLVVTLLAGVGLLALALTGAHRYAFLFGDHQLFGAFLMILLPVPLVRALTERDPKRQQMALAAAALVGVCLLMTGTRSAWLGALASVIALMLFSRIGAPERRPAPGAARKYLVPLLVLLVGSGLFAALGGANSLFGTPLGANRREESLAYRETKWRAAEKLFLRRPLFGNGLGTFPFLQEPYSQSGRPPEFVVQNRPTLAEMAHNFWLQMAAEQGLIGVGLFAGIVVAFLRAGIRRLRFMEGGIRRSLLLACLCGVVGFTVDALGNPAWQFAQVSLFFWLLLGLGVACLRPRTPRAEN